MPIKLHKLQYLRRKANLSQEKMAEQIGLTVHGYRKLEQGQRKITLDLAVLIKRVLGLQHVDDILDDAV